MPGKGGRRREKGREKREGKREERVSLLRGERRRKKTGKGNDGGKKLEEEKNSYRFRRRRRPLLILDRVVTEEELELREPDQRRGPRHEPADNGVRQEIREEAEPEHADEGVKDAGEEGHLDGGAVVRSLAHGVRGLVGVGLELEAFDVAGDDARERGADDHRGDGDGADGLSEVFLFVFSEVGVRA